MPAKHICFKLRPQRADGQKNLAQLESWIAAQEGLDWVSPQAGLIGLGRLPQGVDSDHFAKFLLNEPYRTFLLPGSAYHQPNHIRLGVGGGTQVNFQEGLNRLSKALRDYLSTDPGTAT